MCITHKEQSIRPPSPPPIRRNCLTFPHRSGVELAKIFIWPKWVYWQSTYDWLVSVWKSSNCSFFLLHVYSMGLLTYRLGLLRLANPFTLCRTKQTHWSCYSWCHPSIRVHKTHLTTTFLCGCVSESVPSLFLCHAAANQVSMAKPCWALHSLFH